MIPQDLLAITFALIPTPIAAWFLLKSGIGWMRWQGFLGFMVWLDAAILGLIVSDLAGRIGF